MRYVKYQENGNSGLGVVLGDDVVDIAAIVPGAPATMLDLVTAGEAFHRQVRDRAADGALPRRPLAQCRIEAPLLNAGKIICLGLNYAEHAKEGGHDLPDYPSLFLRASTSLIGPDEPMIVPRCSERLDYEVELAIVIGKRCRYVREEDAQDVIFGYTAFNDGSVRDYQRRTTQWTAGKNFDGTGALGPWIVTADDLPAGAKGLDIRTRLNGKVMQESNTDHMIFNVHRTIAILTEIMTLEPGDLIATGTPSGVGHARTPPVWMRPGDVVEVEIEGIGILRNPIAAEAEAQGKAVA